MKSFLHDALGWIILVACPLLLIWNFLARWDEAIKNEPPLPMPETNTAVASFYAHAYHGRTMANGQPYDMHKLTFASNKYPFGTKIKFTRNGKSVIGTRADAGPFKKIVKNGKVVYVPHPGRMFDFSYAMACSLDMLEVGIDAIQFTIIE